MRTCSDCSTLFTDRLPAGSEAKDYVNWGYYDGGLTVPEFVLDRLAQTIIEFEAFRQRNTWLDVGCGAGTLVKAADRGGWSVTGTEVSPVAAEAVSAHGYDVLVGELGELDLPEKSFDVVSLVEVIEHVPGPNELLTQVCRLVRPGGAVYITTPHARGISGRLLGSRWSIVSPPEHLQLYSTAGIRSSFRSAGLTIHRVRTHTVNPYELVAALRRPRAGTEYLGNTETSYRLNEALSENAFGRTTKTVCNAALNATRLGDSLKVIARRPEAD